MKLAIKTALLGTTLAMGGTTIAQAAVESSEAHPMPLCSKTVTDECMNPSQAPRAMMAKARYYKARGGHRHSGQAARDPHPERAVMRK